MITKRMTLNQGRKRRVIIFEAAPSFPFPKVGESFDVQDGTGNWVVRKIQDTKIFARFIKRGNSIVIETRGEAK